jgi:hypothetical protein
MPNTQHTTQAAMPHRERAAAFVALLFWPTALRMASVPADAILATSAREENELPQSHRLRLQQENEGCQQKPLQHTVNRDILPVFGDDVFRRPGDLVALFSRERARPASK